LQGALGTVIDEHLSRLSGRARLMLDAASVLGREFRLAVLTAAFGFHADELAEGAHEATVTGVLIPSELDTYVFSHALLRDRLYEALPPTRRAELHWQAGSAFAPGATRAHHLIEGHTAGDWQVAAEAVSVAGTAALGQLAYEEVIALIKRARAAIKPGTRFECEHDLLHAEALIRAGKADEGRALSKHAALVARELDSPELMARAALVYGTEFIASKVDPAMVELLEVALAHLPAGPSAVRARLLARLASALSPPLDTAGAVRIVETSRDALAMAREIGDREALLYCCSFMSFAAGYLIGFDERALLVSEGLALARELGQQLALERLSGLQIVLLVEQGRRAEANVELRAFEELTEKLPRRHRARLLAVQSVLAVLDGRMDDAARLSNESRTGGSPNSPVEALWGLQCMAMAQASGSPASIAPKADELLRVGAGKRG
jgi:hypothetical protein